MQDETAEFDDPVENLSRRFEDDEFFSADQRNKSIRGLLHELDEVGVNGQDLVIETGKPNHFSPVPCGPVSSTQVPARCYRRIECDPCDGREELVVTEGLRRATRKLEGSGLKHKREMPMDNQIRVP